MRGTWRKNCTPLPRAARHSRFTLLFESFDDHRIAMCFAIAAEAAGASLRLSDREVAGVSFPNFFAIINSLRQ